MLSKENYDKLNTNYLYKKDYNEKEDGYILGGNPYHCRNWTFQCNKYEDENGIHAYMNDTYFGDKGIEVTDQNIDKFKFVFDFREVERTNCPEEYAELDLFRIATDSGGYSCGRLDWVRKGAKKSKTRLIYNAQQEVESCKRNLEWAEEDLQRLLDGSHWKLK